MLLRCQSGRRALTFGIDFWKDKAQMIQETLSKIEARIRKLSSLRDENKAELLSLLARLKSEIGELSKTHSEEAQSITAFAEVSTHEAASAAKSGAAKNCRWKGCQPRSSNLRPRIRGWLRPSMRSA